MFSSLPRSIPCLGFAHSGPPLKRFRVPTRAAVPVRSAIPPCLDDDVVANQGVPMHTFALQRLSGPRPRGAHQILSQRHWVEVVRVDAMADAAQVIQREAVGNRPDLQLIRESVGEPLAALDVEVPVASSDAASPQPTLAGLIDFRPEPFADIHHGVILTC